MKLYIMHKSLDFKLFQEKNGQKIYNMHNKQPIF